MNCQHLGKSLFVTESMDETPVAAFRSQLPLAEVDNTEKFLKNLKTASTPMPLFLPVVDAFGLEPEAEEAFSVLYSATMNFTQVKFTF